MPWNRRIAPIASLMCFLFATQYALATNSYMSSMRQRYPRIAGTRLESCSVCHTTAPSLNAYGQAYRSAGRNFAAVEALDSDGDGFTNLNEFNGLTFPGDSKDYSKTSLYFPITVQMAPKSTSFAIVNTGSSEATVVLSLLLNSGQEGATGTSVTNYSVKKMPAQSQLANLASELFGSGLQLSGGWMKLTSPQTGITGFFLIFDDRLTTLDGAGAAAGASSQVIPILQNAEVSLVNTSDSRQASADLSLFDDNGQKKSTVTVSIPANGRYASTTEALFSSGLPAGSGYLMVNANPAVAATEFFGPAGGENAALNGFDVTSAAQQVYLPQFAAGGGTWSSNLTIVNTEASPTRLTVSFISDGGLEIGKTASFDLAGYGRLEIADPSAFGLPIDPPELQQGYIRILSSATRISSFVRFGDASGLRFRSALPCAVQSRTDLLFSQVAVDDTWFTGLAVLNPGESPADLTISVYDTQGRLAGSGTRTLAKGARFSLLLSQLVPNLPSLTKGFFTVHSTQPVAGFAVFGTHSLSVLSAVPPQ